MAGEALDPNRDFTEKPIEKTVVDGLFAELAAGGKDFPPDSPRGLLEKNTHASLVLAIKANPKWAEPQARLAIIETDSIGEDEGTESGDGAGFPQCVVLEGVGGSARQRRTIM